MMHPNLKGLEVPVQELTHMVLLYGGGDLTIVLISKETWDSWSDQEDATQFTDNIPNELKLEFTDIKKVFGFVVDNGIRVADAVHDYAY